MSDNYVRHKPSDKHVTGSHNMKEWISEHLIRIDGYPLNIGDIVEFGGDDWLVSGCKTHRHASIIDNRIIFHRHYEAVRLSNIIEQRKQITDAVPLAINRVQADE